MAVAGVCVSIRLSHTFEGCIIPREEVLFCLWVHYSLFEVDGCKGKKSACVENSGATLVAMRFSMGLVGSVGLIEVDCC